jgi:3-oxoacyl-[acyl-carrier protein] reductase
MNLDLKDKVVLVTGASRGLGFAAAHLFAEEGAKVAINGRNPTTLVNSAELIHRETGGDVIALAGDVTQLDAATALVEETVAAFGKLDILVTNAGGPPAGSFESFDDSAWHKAVDLSFMSHVRLIRAALPYLKQSACPSILTVTSLAARQPIPNLILSNSVRAAVLGLTKSLSQELGPAGVRVNSVLPGWTETERVTELMQARAWTNGSSVEEEKRKQAAESPLGRLGLPEDFARAVVFLSSPAASYITGIMLLVNGGSNKNTI